ncbi:MAG: DUF5779 family protein [Halobacteriales archaeon]
MADFDLDLGPIEQEIDADADRRIVLGVLDGSTPPEEWVETVANGDVLALAIEGTLTDLAAEFAPAVREAGGSVVHFRDFLVVAPADIEVDTDRL